MADMRSVHYPDPPSSFLEEEVASQAAWQISLSEAWRFHSHPPGPGEDTSGGGSPGSGLPPEESFLYPDYLSGNTLSVDPEALHVGLHLSEFSTPEDRVEARESLELQEINCGVF